MAAAAILNLLLFITIATIGHTAYFL